MFDNEYEGPYEAPPENSKKAMVEVEVSWSNSDVMKQVVSVIAKQIRQEIEADVKAAVEKKLENQVNATLESVLDHKIERTNQWGESTGVSGSIRELLMRDVENWLNDKVDENGRAFARYGKNQTRAQYLFNSMFKGRDSKLAKIVKEAIARDIGNIQEAVEAAVKEEIRKKLK